MDALTIDQSVELFSDLGLKGFTFAAKTEGQRNKYLEYQNSEAFKNGEMAIPVVYFPYNFSNASEDDLWKKTLALPELKALWVIILDTDATTAGTTDLLTKMSQEAQTLGKDIVIYPHDNTFIESVEDAIPYIKAIQAPNLYLSMHSCHELRAGNGDRMLEVAIKAKPYLKFVSIAGADITLNPNTDANWTDAIKPLDQGDYDISKFLIALNKIEYQGEIFLHTFGIREGAKDHIGRSVEAFEEEVKIINAPISSISEALDAPESAYYDEGSEAWYISNLGGGKVTLEKDQYGWITKLDKQGELVEARWVQGLDAPTGMSSWKGHLYVGDRGVLVDIDLKSGEVIQKIKLPGSEFINDVAISSEGQIYISDTFTNRIYKVSPAGEVEIWLESEKLEFPNGLLISEDELIVATWGPMTNLATFETSKKGSLLKINLKDKSIKPVGIGAPIANLDGVLLYDGHYYATDWTGGKLLKIDAKGNVEEIVTGFNQFADLGINPQSGEIMIPEMSKNRVIKVNIKAIKD
ncbi:hypothetical protein GCM10007049_06330 [Echinicola pacifica]|uniref:Xylose isomerase-like TIM barrel domain-containing protein n=2 Tax=Echinicola pacifica TaxID=346377 RepID=A0A918PNM5_9BACT|nr:hypothetical protein GCM10007049_06330 [Echinicola pacifica]